jgi:hypothetical protein
MESRALHPPTRSARSARSTYIYIYIYIYIHIPTQPPTQAHNTHKYTRTMATSPWCARAQRARAASCVRGAVLALPRAAATDPSTAAAAAAAARAALASGGGRSEDGRVEGGSCLFGDDDNKGWVWMLSRWMEGRGVMDGWMMDAAGLASHTRHKDHQDQALTLRWRTMMDKSRQRAYLLSPAAVRPPVRALLLSSGLMGWMDRERTVSLSGCLDSVGVV